ncbi:MAG: alcohol dehydrogenase [Actinobacteria bacterium RBG_16_64_13]|nr:MAG: alcohol dehydrogenase [Actinobacteria bacterium RBG_16_64_13]
MKAVVFTRYGTADVLELRDVPRPTPIDDEVLIRVRAVAINDWDWQALQGIPFVNRLTFGLRKPKKQILGSDIAGVVEAVGKNAKRFRLGDEVFGDLSGRWGGFAEYVCAREDMLAPKPAGLTFEETAAIPQAAMLAVQALRDKGRIRQGQKLLVNGAGGGVGTFAIQIARPYWAETTGVDSTAKLAMLRSLGYDYVLDYAQEDFTRTGKQYDLILDVKTNRSIFAYLRALSPGGAYVTVGGSMGRLVQAMALGPLVSMVRKKRVRVVALKPNKDLGYITELVEAGQVRPAVDGRYTLGEAAAAMRYFGAGSHRGKVVLTVE